MHRKRRTSSSPGVLHVELLAGGKDPGNAHNLRATAANPIPLSLSLSLSLCSAIGLAQGDVRHGEGDAVFEGRVLPHRVLREGRRGDGRKRALAANRMNKNSNSSNNNNDNDSNHSNSNIIKNSNNNCNNSFDAFPVHLAEQEGWTG